LTNIIYNVIIICNIVFEKYKAACGKGGPKKSGGYLVPKKPKLKIIPLGGLNEIGKNMTVIEYGNDIIVIDCGLAFPDGELLGVDIVIPDASYLVKNADKVRGIVLTHGHEDHIGALPYILKNLQVPVYGTRLTLGLVELKLSEHGVLGESTLKTIKAGSQIKLGSSFKVEFVRVNHSIADSVGLAITTPQGTIVHTGDFKIDTTPIESEMIDLARFGEIGKRGVLLLMSDSTNVERRGFTMSESSVGERFDDIFRNSQSKRIIVATFSSNIHRVQQIINAAVKYKRKIAVSGRSMLNVIDVAMKLGYLHVPENTIIDLDTINRYKPSQLVIITTGSQGEAMSALTRMAFSDHKKIELGSGDLVIFSSSPIPGNEKSVSNLINELFKKGVDVIYESLSEVHVSGHACSEELKIILSLIKPKYFMPVHGEHRHLVKHKQLAQAVGVKEKNIFIMDIGDTLEIDEKTAKIGDKVCAGRVLVDGYGVGDVGNVVLRDRKHLGEDGIIVVVVGVDGSGNILSGPEVISRGFVYVKESGDLMEEIRDVVFDAVESARYKHGNDFTYFKSNVRNRLSDFIYEETKRKPMILPIVMEI